MRRALMTALTSLVLIAAIAAPSYVHADCSSRTPFGRPVVPDV